MAVQPDQAQVVGREHPAHGIHGRAGGQGQPELLVLVGGGDEFVGVRFHTHGDPHQHVLHDAGLTGDLVETLDLDHGVDDDVTDAVLDGRGQFSDRFVVAVQGDSFRRKAGVQRHGQLATAGHVEGQALLSDPAGDLGAQERLRGIVHVLAAAERAGDLLAAAAEVGLVDDEHRGAELGGDVGDRHAGDRDDTVVTANGVVGPHVRGQRQHLGCGARPVRGTAVVHLLGVPGAGGVGDHIRSGALTPRMARPLAMTWRVAWHSASRAECSSPGSSSPWGSTRHES